MTNQKSFDHQLALLINVARPPALPAFAKGNFPSDVLVPDDYLALIAVYGKGYFNEKSVGNMLGLLSPFEPDYMDEVGHVSNLLREFKTEQGDDYVPYSLYPDNPGLLLWAEGEQRKHYFWHTVGEPTNWPVVVLYDLEIFTEFPFGALTFVQQLFCGTLKADFIGVRSDKGKIKPSNISFHPHPMP